MVHEAISRGVRDREDIIAFVQRLAAPAAPAAKGGGKKRGHEQPLVTLRDGQLTTRTAITTPLKRELEREGGWWAEAAGDGEYRLTKTGRALPRRGAPVGAAKKAKTKK